MTQSDQSSSREQRMCDMVAELQQLAAAACSHVDVMRGAVQESVRWSDPADAHWAKGALDDAIASAAEAERDLKTARALVEELFA